jgi:hypothetical protein
MLVRKVRGQDKIGKILMSQSEIAIVRKLGIPVELYIKERLARIAKERKWKWYFTKDANEINAPKHT